MSRRLLRMVQISFMLHKAVCDVCHENRSTHDGQIMSPDLDYDGFYDNDVSCSWHFDTDSQLRLYYYFAHMDVEYHPTCDYDYVMVVDNKFLQGQFCGKYIPPPLISKTYYGLVIYWLTDSLISHSGFNITYHSVQDFYCASVEVDITGYFGSPDNDGDTLYDNNIECIWTLISPTPRNGVLKQVYVTHMDIETSSKCRNDFLRIYSESDRNTDVFCVKPPMYSSMSRAVFVEFATDDRINGKGFSAVYAMIDKDETCGGILTTPLGAIRSPGDQEGGKYWNSMACNWAIIAPDDSTIELEWHHLDLEDSSFCAFDFIEIYDGKFAANSVVARYCGTTLPPVYRSATSALYLLFITDYKVAGTGFTAIYRHINRLTTADPTSVSSTSDTVALDDK